MYVKPINCEIEGSTRWGKQEQEMRAMRAGGRATRI